MRKTTSAARDADERNGSWARNFLYEDTTVLTGRKHVSRLASCRCHVVAGKIWMIVRTKARIASTRSLMHGTDWDEFRRGGAFSISLRCLAAAAVPFLLAAAPWDGILLCTFNFSC